MPDDKNRYLLQAHLLRPESPEVKVQFKTMASQGELNLGTRNGYTISAGWQHRLDRNWQIGVVLSHVKWEFDESNDDTIIINGREVTIFQPKNETKQNSLQLTIQKRFY